MTRARAKLLGQQVNSLLIEYDVCDNENFILPKSMHLCMLRVVDNTNIGGGPEEQQELEYNVTYGAREEREECAKKEEEEAQAARPEAGLSPARPARHPKHPASETQEGRPLPGLGRPCARSFGPQPGLGRACTRAGRPQSSLRLARPVCVSCKSQPGLAPAWTRPARQIWTEPVLVGLYLFLGRTKPCLSRFECFPSPRTPIKG